MTVWVKQDVQGDLIRPMVWAHGKQVQYARERGRDVYVTSRREGLHSDTSLHPFGGAEDWRTGPRPRPDELDPEEVEANLNQQMKVEHPEWRGKFQVVLEHTHLHTEWEPEVP